jgi:hypothetical protein
MGRMHDGILVKDRNGVRFTVVAHEEMLTDLGPARLVVWFELDTGERVDVIDANTFVLVRTGKKLRRIRSGKERLVSQM